MLRRVLFILGVVLLFFGCSTCFAIYQLTSRASNLHKAYSIVSDAPTNPFQAFECPALVNQGEAISIRATLANPASETLVYSLSVKTIGLQIDAIAALQEVTLAAGQTVEFTWQAAATDEQYHEFTVEAISDKDLALPGPFHFWPTSFRDGCVVEMFAGPLKYQYVACLGLAGLLAGAALAFPWLAQQIKRRQDQPPADEYPPDSQEI